MVSFDLFEGNPGAIRFCEEAYRIDMIAAERGFQRMDNHGIRGSKLYMLWNDCCNRDTAKAIKIMDNNSIDDIKKHINYEQGRGIAY